MSGVRQNDKSARTVLAELAIEYSHRYGGTSCYWFAKLTKHPVGSFADPDGAFLVVLADGVPVAGGAYQRVDTHTAELKRIWTSSAHRRRGLARRMLADLEGDIAERGYRRIVLTTGPRQPEAHGLYLQADYVQLHDQGLDADEVGLHRFEKSIEPGGITVVGGLGDRRSGWDEAVGIGELHPRQVGADLGGHGCAIAGVHVGAERSGQERASAACQHHRAGEDRVVAFLVSLGMAAPRTDPPVSTRSSRAGEWSKIRTPAILGSGVRIDRERMAAFGAESLHVGEGWRGHLPETVRRQ